MAIVSPGTPFSYARDVGAGRHYLAATTNDFAVTKRFLLAMPFDFAVIACDCAAIAYDFAATKRFLPAMPLDFAVIACDCAATTLDCGVQTHYFIAITAYFIFDLYYFNCDLYYFTLTT